MINRLQVIRHVNKQKKRREMKAREMKAREMEAREGREIHDVTLKKNVEKSSKLGSVMKVFFVD